MTARAIGSGTISFGLVSIPVKLYTTTQTGSSVSFNMVHAECGSKLKQQYVCPRHDEVIPRSDMAKGYEFAKGQYVVLSSEEVKALEAVATNTIQLTEFVPASQVDPLYFEKSYYMGPDKGGERAYKLLGQVMNESGRVGIAKYAARGKQYLVLLRPYGEDGLIMHQLRYEDEVKSFAEVPIDDTVEVGDAELKLALQIVNQISSETFQPGKYKDEVKTKVLDLIQSKIEGQEITAAPEAPQAQVIDLMAALKQSLGMSAASTAPTKAKAKAPSKAKATKTKKRTG